ncbi:MAG: TRAP transporter substrate-binding protein [Deltaproteobacteria bacterium]|nr:TRAP transporter substrate-binding protein [Deltaproteobacteria bacterium]
MTTGRRGLAAKLCTLMALVLAALAGSAAEAKVTLKFSHFLSEGTPMHKGAVKFAELVAAKSKGEMEVQVFPNAQLANVRETPGALKTGTIDVSVMDYAMLAPFRNGRDFNVFMAPFAFRDTNHLLAFLRSPVLAEIISEFNNARVGFQVFAYFGDRSPKQLSTKTKPVKTPADLKGLKIRVAPFPMHLEIFRAWGAAPTPVEFSELFTALQTGLVDGEDSDVISVAQMKFYEVEKNVALLAHLMPALTLVMSDKAWDSLTPAQRKIVIEAGAEAGEFQSQTWRAQELKDLETLKAKGMNITVPDRQAFAAMIEPLLEEWDSSGKFWRKGLLQEVRKLKSK